MDMRLEGKVIPVAKGEAIVCEIPLGICKLIVISNIPDDGNQAVCYVKVRPMNERPSKPKPHGPRKTNIQDVEILRR